MNGPWTDNPGFLAVVIFALLTGVGFVLGALRNRRLMERYLSAVRHAILQIAPRATAHRLGTSGYHVIAEKAKPPYRKLKVLILLQPREFSLYWAFNHLRGRGDRIVVQASLRRPPGVAVEAGPQGKVPPSEPDQPAWESRATSPWPGSLYVSGSPTPDWEEALQNLAEQAPDLQRLSIRRAPPHLLLVLTAASLEDPGTPARILQSLTKLLNASQG